MPPLRLSDVQRAFIAGLDTDGRITPDLVKEAARPEDSPIHALVFDKDDKQAAEDYFLYRARVVIQSYLSVVVTTQHVEVSAPCYVRDVELDGGQQGYRSMESLRTDPVAARQTFARELGRALTYPDRAHRISQALEIPNRVVERTIMQLRRVQQQVEHEIDAHVVTLAEPSEVLVEA